MTKVEESNHSTVEMEGSRLMKLPFETIDAIFSHVSVIARIPMDCHSSSRRLLLYLTVHD